MAVFKERLFHLDLRIQVMVPSALHKLAQQLFNNGFTTLVIEWEATFPFQKHPVLGSRFVYTKKEVVTFLRFCKSIGLKTLPIQQCFGHVEYILQHDLYAHLREDERDICQICPLKIKEALPLFKELFSELIAVHDSPYFYVGCDETYILGKCPLCEAKAKKVGKSRLYVDYLIEILKLVKSFGKRSVIPADMLLKYPEAAGILPKETILVDWNYGWAPGKFGPSEALIKLGFEFWGSMSLRSGPDNYYLLSWEKHLNNYRDFVPYCRENGYSGVMLTSFSTSGIYGSEWEAFYEVVALHPIRRVYPLNGFHLLLMAFVKGVETKSIFDINAFVETYAVERYGLTPLAAKKFRFALLADSSSVYKPKTEFYWAPKVVLKSVAFACKVLHSLKPTQNASEFGHYRLMAAIRKNYLQLKLVEETVSGDKLTDTMRRKAVTQIKNLLNKEKLLANIFSTLMRGYLHPAEIKAENMWRKRKWTLLLEKLERKRT